MISLLFKIFYCPDFILCYAGNIPKRGEQRRRRMALAGPAFGGFFTKKNKDCQDNGKNRIYYPINYFHTKNLLLSSGCPQSNRLCGQTLFKNRYTPLQYPLYMRDGYAVIGKRHAMVGGAAAAVLHLAVIEHAGPAVDDNPVPGKIVRKIAAGAETELKRHAAVVLYHAGQFDRADVVALAVVGAALADKDFIAAVQIV
jgi:hypothetical protein